MRKLILAIVALTAGGLALTAWEPGVRSRPAAMPGAPQRTSATLRGSDAGRVSIPRDAPTQATGTQYKYRYLLTDLAKSGPARERLPGLLAARERLAPGTTLEGESVAPGIATARRLTAIEQELHTLLTPAAWEQYQLYRDSDAEQAQLDEYTGGLREYAPLDATQQRALLDARLRQKRVFERLLEDAGLDRPALSLAEREHAWSLIERGLRDYRENYLAEIAPRLDERQFAALASFEFTEFQGELERLQRIVNAR